MEDPGFISNKRELAQPKGIFLFPLCAAPESVLQDENLANRHAAGRTADALLPALASTLFAHALVAAGYQHRSRRAVETQHANVGGTSSRAPWAAVVIVHVVPLVVAVTPDRHGSHHAVAEVDEAPHHSQELSLADPAVVQQLLGAANLVLLFQTNCVPLPPHLEAAGHALQLAPRLLYKLSEAVQKKPKVGVRPRKLWLEPLVVRLDRVVGPVSQPVDAQLLRPYLFCPLVLTHTAGAAEAAPSEEEVEVEDDEEPDREEEEAAAVGVELLEPFLLPVVLIPLQPFLLFLHRIYCLFPCSLWLW